MSVEHKPCGCLTDGYNWLAECDRHRRIRQSRNDLLAACKLLLNAQGEESAPTVDTVVRAIAKAEGR